MKERPILFSAPMVRAILGGGKTQTRRMVKMRYGGDVVVTNGRVWKPARVDYAGYVDCPYGAPGDQLWVREAWQYADWTEDGDPWIGYRADGAKRACECIPPEWSPKLMDIWADLSEDAACDGRAADQHWRPSIFQPRWASRITLEIISTRVERLQDISEADAMAEGVKPIVSGTWWQGYRQMDEHLLHTQFQGDDPPDWMIEPKRMAPTPHLDLSAKQGYEFLWGQINGPSSWDSNPWVWVLEFRRVQA